MYFYAKKIAECNKNALTNIKKGVKLINCICGNFDKRCTLALTRIITDGFIFCNSFLKKLLKIYNKSAIMSEPVYRLKDLPHIGRMKPN